MIVWGGFNILGFFLHLIAIYSENAEFFPRCEDSVIKAYFLLSEGSQCYRKGQKNLREGIWGIQFEIQIDLNSNYRVNEVVLNSV